MDTETVLKIVLLTTAAGVCIPIGGWVASFERVHSQWLERELRHFIIAFGGGILLGAVTIVLVPEGINNMHSLEYSSDFVGWSSFFLH
jgi:zinc transporter, ZIP family